MNRFWLFSLFCFIGVACTTSPLGRKQFIAVSDSQMDQMGVQAFEELKKSDPIDSDPRTVRYIRCIVDPLTQTAQDQTSMTQWEVVVFKKKEANAFALPGGKIGVHTGILKVARSDAQLAAVVGHEIGHVIAKHGAERVSQQFGAQLGMGVLSIFTSDSEHHNTLMGLLGAGTQIGILLPFSRTQESEADLIGLDLMSRSGFDPQESVALWRNMMAAAGGKAPPQILSTHPASENRIRELQAHMDEALAKYAQARAAGRSPQCDRSQLRL
jgi:predicted Zn-dependent protease